MGNATGIHIWPSAFLVYMNDIYQTSNNLRFILFAYDTSMFLYNDNIDSLISELNAEFIMKINSWLIFNKLVLKTHTTSNIILFLQTDQLVMIQ